MSKSKRIAAVLVTVALLLVALIIYILAWAGFGQKVDFQEYKPSHLPSGLAITDGRFYVLRVRETSSFTKHISVNFNAPNSWLAEWKSNGILTNPCSAFPDNKTCSTHTTTHGQQYQLTVNTDPNTMSPIYDVRFIKGGTEVWITLRDFKKDIHTTEWSKAVDSFQPGHYDRLRTRRGSASGP